MADALELLPRSILRKPVLLDDRGLTLGKKHIAWDDVEFYTYVIDDGLIVGDIYVISKSDAFARIDRRYHTWQLAADRILGELHPRLRADPDFFPFRLDADGLHHVVAGNLPLAEIERVELVHGPSIAVVQRGIKRDWTRDALETVHDSVLFLEELVARGVAVTASISIWLPPSSQGLADALAREANLPSARLVRR